MTRPAKRSQTEQIAIAIKGQLWVLLILIISALLVDMVWFGATNDTQTLTQVATHHVIAKSTALGALLSFVSQAVFAWCVFRRSGYQARQYIVRQMYRGQMIKWAITLIGFIAIFINVKPLSAPALFIGFMLMQVSHGWMLWRLR